MNSYLVKNSVKKNYNKIMWNGFSILNLKIHVIKISNMANLIQETLVFNLYKDRNSRRGMNDVDLLLQIIIPNYWPKSQTFWSFFT